MSGPMTEAEKALLDSILPRRGPVIAAEMNAIDHMNAGEAAREIHKTLSDAIDDLIVFEDELHAWEIREIRPSCIAVFRRVAPVAPFESGPTDASVTRWIFPSRRTANSFILAKILNRIRETRSGD